MASLAARELVTKALSAGASAMGGQAGRLASGEILDLIGLGQVDLADLKSDLAEIQSRLTEIENSLDKLKGNDDLFFVTQSFKDLTAAVEGPFDNVEAEIRAGHDDATRDAKLRTYLAGLDLQTIEARYHRFRDDALGRTSLFDGGRTLPEYMYEHKWDDLFGKGWSIDTVAERAMAICYRLIDLMNRTGILVFNARSARGEREMGASFLDAVATEMKELRRAFIVAAPSMIAYCASGFPRAAGIGGGWSATFRTALPGVDTPYLTSGPVVYTHGKPYTTNMTRQRSEIVLRSQNLDPIRFHLCNDQGIAMSIEDHAVMTHPGRDGYSSGSVWYDEQPPRTQTLPLVVFHHPPQEAQAADTVASLFTTATRGQYLVHMANGEWLKADHRVNDPGAASRAAVGARRMNVCNAVLSGPRASDATTVWQIDLHDGSEAIYAAME